jgi:hypothetical protein
MFYAEYLPWGTNSISYEDTLMRFETKRERDEMVERLNSMGKAVAMHEGCVAQAVTTREIAHRYNLKDFYGARCREVYGLKTCDNKHFFEIHHRVNYRF